jgi:hypothetical protein
MSEAENRAKLEALRAAAKVGQEAIVADRFREFDSEDSLRDDLGGLAEEAIVRARK